MTEPAYGTPGYVFKLYAPTLEDASVGGIMEAARKLKKAGSTVEDVYGEASEAWGDMGMEVSEASAMGRVDAWYHGIQMFLAKPVLGIGPGAYSDNFALTAHNSFVLVLAEVGIIGFTVWLAFVGYTARMLLEALGGSAVSSAAAAEPARAQDHDPDSEPDPDVADAAAFAEAERTDDLAIAKALLLSFCGLLVTAFFLSRSYVVLPYLLIALVTAHYAGMRERYPGMVRYRLLNDVLRWPLWSVLAVAGLYLTVKTLLAIA